MATEGDETSAAIENRDRIRRQLRDSELPEQRLARFVQLQRRLFALLQASPEAFQHFLRRNYHSRRAELIDGEWRPVSPDRRSDQG